MIELQLKGLNTNNAAPKICENWTSWTTKHKRVWSYWTKSTMFWLKIRLYSTNH